MTIKAITSPHVRAAEDAAFASAQQAYEGGKLPVVVVRNHEDAVRLRKDRAHGPQSFGLTVTTLEYWVADLWELFGDGRNSIGRVDRLALITSCIKKAEGLEAGFGTVSMLAAMAKEALPLIEPNAELTAEESMVIQTIEAYGRCVDRADLIESSQVLQALSSCQLGSYAVFVLGYETGDLTTIERAFLDHLDATLVVDARTSASDEGRVGELVSLQNSLFRPNPAHPVEATAAVRFLLPAGEAARTQALVDEIVRQSEACLEGDIVVAVRDAAATFSHIAPRLNAFGLGVSYRGSIQFLRVDAGRALVQLINFVAQQDDFNTFLATDFAFNPFAAVSWKTAFYFDNRWRGDRLLDKNEVLTDLSCHTAEAMQGVIGSLESNHPLEAIEAMRAYALGRFDWQESYRAEQLAALNAASDFFYAAEQSGLSQQETLLLLEQQAVNVSGVLGDGRVVVMGLDEASRQPPSSCAVLVVSDLTAAAYPVKADRDAKLSIFEKLGIAVTNDPLDQTRREFYRALETPSCVLVLERPLNNADAEPAYPAAMFEEVIDCYRTSLTDDAEIDSALSVTKNLVAHVAQASEASLFRNATGLSVQPIVSSEMWPELGEISLDKRDQIVLPRGYLNGAVFDGLDLSPSQIESYLECPYQWFAKRRLNLRAPDEGATSLERGTFVHAILRRFYEQFRQSGRPKVTTESLPFAKRLLEEVFQAQVNHEYRAEKGRRYVAVGQWELRQRDSILFDLFDFLEREVVLLPTYTPAYFEWEFGHDEPFSYAGCNILGTIDRIDVDEENRRAIVIDYKTGLSNDYCLHGTKPTDAFVLPRKMQALMYARVVEQLLGYSVVGAVYLNPLKPEMAGAFDATLLDPAWLPSINSNRNGVPFEHAADFTELLEHAEACVGKRLVRLACGEMTPDPISKEACKYCPVMLCGKRLS